MSTHNVWTYAADLRTIEQDHEQPAIDLGAETRPRDTIAQALADAHAVIGCATIGEAIARLGNDDTLRQYAVDAAPLVGFAIRRIGAYDMLDADWIGPSGSYRTHPQSAALADEYQERMREHRTLAAARAETVAA